MLSDSFVWVDPYREAEIAILRPTLGAYKIH
jgi:hypothetical protein